MHQSSSKFSHPSAAYHDGHWSFYSALHLSWVFLADSSSAAPLNNNLALNLTNTFHFITSLLTFEAYNSPSSISCRAWLVESWHVTQSRSGKINRLANYCVSYHGCGSFIPRVKQQLPELESGWFGAKYMPTPVGDDERQMAFLQFLVADFPVREITPRSLWTLLCKTILD